MHQEPSSEAAHTVPSCSQRPDRPLPWAGMTLPWLLPSATPCWPHTLEENVLLAVLRGHSTGSSPHPLRTFPGTAAPMWKTVFGLHLQEKPPLRFLRGFPAQFLLPPLPTHRESHAVYIALGSCTPRHRRDKMADPSALTHRRAQSHHLSWPSSVPLPAHTAGLPQPQQDINSSRAAAICSAQGCLPPQLVGAMFWLLPTGQVLHSGPQCPPPSLPQACHSYTTPHLETPLSSKRKAELHLTS